MQTYTITEIPIYANNDYVATYIEYSNDRGKYLDHEINIEDDAFLETTSIEESTFIDTVVSFIDKFLQENKKFPETIHLTISNQTITNIKEDIDVQYTE